MDNLRFDLPASIVVFLVALPLCLGIALASGAPLIAGVITGIIGGVVVSLLSGSALAVSGPAAGLAVVVLEGIEDLGYETFLLAVVIGGVVQLALGAARAGVFGYYIPNTVIKGLLSAIGVILILKQVPHALGFDGDPEGDLDFFQPDGRNTLSEIPYALSHFSLGAIIIAVVGLALLITWEKVPQLKKLRWLPGPLVVVALGIILNRIFLWRATGLALEGHFLVNLPDLGIVSTIQAAWGQPSFFGSLLDPGFWQQSMAGRDPVLRFPEFRSVGNPVVWKTGLVVGLIASVETLLCIEAMDKLDPFKRETPTNRELFAQGAGNIMAGLVGGIPMTAVIVRGSANVQAGGRTKMSSFFHGILLLLAVIFAGAVLDMIPKAALAAVLLHVGYKLAPISLFKAMFKRGIDQWIPFMVTLLAILFTDLLIGVSIGIATGFGFILFANLQAPYAIHHREEYDEETGGVVQHHVKIEFGEVVSFLNKAAISKVLHELPEGSWVDIDGSRSTYIDRDVLEMIFDFRDAAHLSGIEVELIAMPNPFEPAQTSKRAQPAVKKVRSPVQVDEDGEIVRSFDHDDASASVREGEEVVYEQGPDQPPSS